MNPQASSFAEHVKKRRQREEADDIYETHE